MKDKALNKNKDGYSASYKRNEDLIVLFNEVFLSYEQSLFKLAFNSCKDSQVAQDIVYDVFLQLWELKSKIYEIKSIEAYLVTMTRNKIIDYLRKAASEKRLKQALWESIEASRGKDMYIEHDRKESREILHKAINSLPSQRKVIYNLRIEGYSYQEIANKLNISKHTVKNQVSASIKSIRNFLSKLILFL